MSRRFLSAVMLLACVPGVTIADTFVWDFTISEDQVRNGPEPDGSTNSPAVGTGHVEYDSDTNVISYTFTWSNLFGDLTKLHVHGPANENQSNPQHVLEIFGPPEIPVGVGLRTGTWSDSYVLETLKQPNFDPLTPEQIIDIMASGLSYVNVHTSVFGMGEIRGNLGHPAPCSAADLVAPFVVLDAFDLIAYLAAFESGDLSADLVAPFGTLDVFDALEFLAMFDQGCP